MKKRKLFNSDTSDSDSHTLLLPKKKIALMHPKPKPRAKPSKQNGHKIKQKLVDDDSDFDEAIETGKHIMRTSPSFFLSNQDVETLETYNSENTSDDMPEDSDKDSVSEHSSNLFDSDSEHSDTETACINISNTLNAIFFVADSDTEDSDEEDLDYFKSNDYNTETKHRAQILNNLLIRTKNLDETLNALKTFLKQHPKYESKIISMTFVMVAQTLLATNTDYGGIIASLTQITVPDPYQRTFNYLLSVVKAPDTDDTTALWLKADAYRDGFCVTKNENLHCFYRFHYMYQVLDYEFSTNPLVKRCNKYLDQYVAANEFSDTTLLELFIGIEIRQNRYDRVQDVFLKSGANLAEWVPFMATYDDDEMDYAIKLLAYLISLGNQQKNINQLITKLTYRLQRYPQIDSDTELYLDLECQLIHEALGETDNPFIQFKLEDYQQYIKKQEKIKGDYFGTQLSDDSDSETEQTFQKNPPQIRNTLNYHAKALCSKIDSNGILTTLQNLLRKKNKSVNNTDRSNLPKNLNAPQPTCEPLNVLTDMLANIDNIHTLKQTKTYTETLFKLKKNQEQIKRDLNKINHFKNKPEFKKELKSLTTQFVVAQYRGIHYNTPTWSQTDRRQHRQANEISKPLYSAAVHEHSKVPFTKPIRSEQAKKLAKSAVIVKKQLLELRKTKKYTRNITKGKQPYEYDNRSLYLQDLYSKGYDACMSILKKQAKQNCRPRHLTLFRHPAIEIGNQPNFKLRTASNPFLSTSTELKHPLKYAYGIKLYNGHKNERLHPRWNRFGRAERPYSGKVYLSLHPIEDYTGEGAAYHLLSLDNLGKVHINVTTLPEHEVTFLAYIKKDRVVYTHVAKYPSFKGPYKELYLFKYGMDKAMYALYQEIFTHYPPHHDQRAKAEDILSTYLCCYYEKYLYNQVHQIAAEQGKVLVYQNEFGDFSLDPPTRTDNSCSKDRTRRREDKQKEGRQNLNHTNNYADVDDDEFQLSI